jgi:hypothetical protein
MKWTFAVAVVSGFVLAMALAFGGPAINGLHIVKSDKEVLVPDPCVCCGGGPLPRPNRNQAPQINPAAELLPGQAHP